VGGGGGRGGGIVKIARTSLGMWGIKYINQPQGVQTHSAMKQQKKSHAGDSD